MKVRGMMPHLHRLILHPLTGKIFLCVLASVYLVYLLAGVRLLSTSRPAPAETISEHAVETNADVVIKYWTAASMRAASDADLLSGQASELTQGSSDQSLGQAVQQQGQPPRDSNLGYPLSTVGKVFLTNAAGRDLVCSGTAVASRNQSVVDTAGHCLYLQGAWVHNVIFCPLYENGRTPYGCWAARDLEVPSDWIDARPADYHHDFGMAIVTANSEGVLTDLVGGAGLAANQPANQRFSAYGYGGDGHQLEAWGWHRGVHPLRDDRWLQWWPLVHSDQWQLVSQRP